MPVLSLRTSGTAWRSVACRDSEKTNRRSLLCPQPDLQAADGIARCAESRAHWPDRGVKTSARHQGATSATGGSRPASLAACPSSHRHRHGGGFFLSRRGQGASTNTTLSPLARLQQRPHRDSQSRSAARHWRLLSAQLFLLHRQILASARRPQRRLFSASVGPPVEIRPHVGAALAAGRAMAKKRRRAPTTSVAGHAPLTKRSCGPDAASIAHTQCRPEAPKALQ
jgi:hypothetical protein